jgi:dolichol-phosphate mannosyltransferase
LNKIHQLLRFLLAGGVGLLLYYGLLYTLTEWAGVWYLFSAIIGFVACYSVNFTLHRKWTFASNSPALMERSLYSLKSG